jgi:hypothetical protein
LGEQRLIKKGLFLNQSPSALRTYHIGTELGRTSALNEETNAWTRDMAEEPLCSRTGDV